MDEAQATPATTAAQSPPVLGPGQGLVDIENDEHAGKAMAMASQRIGVMASPKKMRAMMVAQTGLK